MLNSRNKSRFVRSRSGDPGNNLFSSSPTFNFSSGIVNQSPIERTLNFTRSPTHTNNNSNFTNTMILHHIPDDHSNIHPVLIDNWNKSFEQENEKIKIEIDRMRSE